MSTAHMQTSLEILFPTTCIQMIPSPRKEMYMIAYNISESKEAVKMTKVGSKRLKGQIEETSNGQIWIKQIWRPEKTGRH